VWNNFWSVIRRTVKIQETIIRTMVDAKPRWGGVANGGEVL